MMYSILNTQENYIRLEATAIECNMVDELYERYNADNMRFDVCSACIEHDEGNEGTLRSVTMGEVRESFPDRRCILCDGFGVE